MTVHRITIRALGPTDAPAYRQLRLAALAGAPEAFGSSVAEEEALSLDTLRARLDAAPSVVFAAFAGPAMVGMAGFLAVERAKERHKGVLWGVHVDPAFRGRGIGRALVARVVDHARGHVRVLHAQVALTNAGAGRLYARLGFVRYGIEVKALAVDGVFHDAELLALDLATG